MRPPMKRGRVGLERQRRILHILPHPGGGGETYVEALSGMGSYEFKRLYLAPGPNPAGEAAAILRRAIEVQRAAFSYDVVHVIGEVASMLCLPVLAARPSVISPQGLSLLRRLRGARRRAAELNLRLIVYSASRTICASSSERQDILTVLGPRAARRTLAIQNGVSAPEPVSPGERIAARVELGLPSSAVVGAWIGTLDANKDPLSVITAAKALERTGMPLTLLIAGDGPLRPEVERAASAGGGDAVRVLGFRKDIRRVLAAADFFVISSEREGLSFALLDAMSLGLAPVVSDAPGNVEAVRETGIVVPYRSPNGLAEAFACLVEDAERRTALGRKARDRVRLYFDVNAMIERTRHVYDSLLEAHVREKR
jgi:glycosyltransferase involved in cell wall biosynthesis